MDQVQAKTALSSLFEDEQKAELQKQKKKEKKMRQKLQKVAKKEGISIEEAKTNYELQQQNGLNQDSDSSEPEPVASKPEVIHKPAPKKEVFVAPVKQVAPKQEASAEEQQLRFKKALEAEARAKELKLLEEQES